MKTIDNSIPVIAYDFETREPISRFDSMQQATKKLFIRSAHQVWSYIYRCNERTKKGVKSYKSDIKYHFELAK